MPDIVTPSGPGAGPDPTPDPTAPTSPQLSPTDISTNIQRTTNAAPELAHQPGTAVAVASSGGNVGLKAQAVAQAGKRQAIASAHQSIWGDLGHLGSDVVSGGEKLLGTVAHYANDGLSTVQQEYRYLHDVEARHGLAAAMAEGTVILGAGIVGTVATGGDVAAGILASEGAARIEGMVQYKDSWKNAANPNYRDPHTGQLVSFGRDVASALHLTGGNQTFVSGALDGLGDLVADPVSVGGKVFKAAQEGTLGGIAGKRWTGLGGGDVPITAEMVDHARMVYPRYRRALSQIAEMGPNEIARRFPAFQSIAQTLGHAATPDDVHEVFHDLAKSNELVDSLRLPTMSLTRTATGALHDAARNAGDGILSQTPGIGSAASLVANNPLLGFRRWADRLESMPGATFDPSKMDFSSTEINLSDTRGQRDINAMLRFGNSQRVADAVGDAYANGTVSQRKVILTNAIFDTIFSVAKRKLPGTDQYVQALKRASDSQGIQEALDARGDVGNYLSTLGEKDVVNAVEERFKNYLDGANIDGVPASREYGADLLGQSIGGVKQSDGSIIQAGITSNQTGPVHLPNLIEVRRAAAEINSTKVHQVLARADDFLYDHVTQALFKPLVLMSVGYGWHIALAEAIPNALRAGVLDTSRAMYARALANLGIRAGAVSLKNEPDVHALAGLLWSLGGQRAFNGSERAQQLADYYVTHEMYRRPVGMAAGEVTSGETQPVLRAESGLKQNAIPTKATGDWTLYGDDNKRFAEEHHAWLRRNANDRWTQTAAREYLKAMKSGSSQIEASEQARQAVADQLREEPQEVHDIHLRSSLPMDKTPDTWDNVDNWAHAITENMKGSVHARPSGLKDEAGNLIPGDPNMDLLRSVANGHTPDLNEIKAMPTELRPLKVPGKIVVPRPGNGVQWLAEKGFKKVLDPMVNMISRNQEFAIEYTKNLDALQAKVDSGIMTEDERVVQASAAATVHSMRFIHNLNDRTQWTATMRNFAPFFFAQEQAYRRMGRMLAEDPGAFRRYQLMIVGANHFSARMQDGNGNSYIALPGTGLVGKGLADVMGLHGFTLGGVSPASYGGSSSSANIIFPLSQGFKPDVGPVAILPMNAAGVMFSELGKSYPQYQKVTQAATNALHWVDGTGSVSTPLWEQIIPNAFVSHLVDAFSDQRAFESSIMQAYQLATYQQGQAVDKWVADGRKGPMPQIIPSPIDLQNNTTQAQAFKDKITNWVRMLYIGRALTAFVSPISASTEINNFGFSQDLTNAINKIDPKTGKPAGVTQGFQDFLLAHPTAGSYTVAQSFTPTGSGGVSGVSLPTSDQGETWIENNMANINKYGSAYYWLMPQLTNSKYDPAVYNEQIAQGLRIKDTPQQFLNQLYISAGDSQYFASLTVHENNLASAGNSSVAKNDEYDKWNAYVSTLQSQNPVWARDFFSNTREFNAKDAITGLKQIFKDGAAPDDLQSRQVEALLGDYNLAAANYAAAGQTANYSHAQAQVYDGWVQYLDAKEVALPSLKPVISSVFKVALKPVS